VSARPLLILGAGSFALETLDIAETSGGFEPLGFVNSLEQPGPGATLAGLPVFWIEAVPFDPADCWVVCGIISTRRRDFVETMAGRGYRLASVVHPSAILSRRSQVGEGCVVNAGVIVSSNTCLEDNVIVNRGCLIGHDNLIRSFCTLGPGANVAGAVEIGAGAYIGLGAVIRDHITIGAEAVVGAGAVVVKSVPANVLVTGIPAQISKTQVKGL
jgi:sugar O-acyltransferase (sialic acid O-acetyltransferase NeuD family)